MIVLKIGLLIIAYLFGAIPWGFVIGKMKGIDIREHGSKNIGTTNTGRVLGKKYAYLTYGLDMLKGFLFVFLFRFEIIPTDLMILSPALYGFLAILGHTFPVYLNFKGGKAVATSSGYLLGYCPWLFLICFIAFMIIVFISKYVSLASLITSMIALIGVVLLTIFGVDPIFNKPIDIYFLIISILAVILIFARHKTNIKRLKNHDEAKIFEK